MNLFRSSSLIVALFSFFITNKTLAQVNLGAGQQVYLNFNGNANDVSGNSNNGVVNGATLVQDKWGNSNGAYRFDGVDDYIRIPTSTSLQFSSNNFTIYYLIKPKGFYQGTCHGNYVVSRGNLETESGAFLSGYYDGPFYNFNHCSNPVEPTKQVFMSGHATGSGITTYPPNYIQIDKYYCITTIAYTDSIKTYVDGVLQFATEKVGGNVSTRDFLIGGRNANAHPFWVNAVIDEVRVYDRVLNTAEIDALCNYTYIPESISKIEKEPKRIQIFPNPAGDQVKLMLDDGLFNGGYMITDMTGKVISRKKLFLTNTISEKVDISNLAKGIYLLKINSTDYSETHKLVVE